MPEASKATEAESSTTPQIADGSGDWRSRLSFIADISQKLAIPLLTVAATGFGIYLSHAANERQQANRIREQQVADQNSRLSLQNQREQSETGLRSTMFKELVGPMLREVSGNQDPGQAAQQLALLAELLTLNFHEHFELGPALRYVDTLPNQSQDARLRLRSTARRVISRQLAPMFAAPAQNQGRSNPAFIEVTLNGDIEDVAADTGGSIGVSPVALPACRTEGKPDVDNGLVRMTCSSRPATADGAQLQTMPLIVTSPDGQDRVKVTLSSFNWIDQMVGVFAELQPPEDPTLALKAKNRPLQRVEFTLSSYSLPFSDNTLLPSGNRFGLYIRSIDDIPGIVRQMTVWFVWFPKGFVPPRERPFILDVELSGS